MKKKLKSLLDNRQETVPSYICTKCTLRYSAFDVIPLLDDTDDTFRCEKCNTTLVAERAAMKAEDESHRLLLEKVEEQLKPLTNQLALLKDLSPPEYVSLQAWEGKQAVHVANESQGKTMPSTEEQKVLTAENSKGNDGESLKDIPPDIENKGLNFDDEKREVEGNSYDEKATDGTQNDNANASNDEKATDGPQNLEAEYLKAYHLEMEKLYQSKSAKAAAEEIPEDTPTERRVGQKVKREESDEDEDEDDDGFDQLDPFATGVDSETIDKESKQENSPASDAKDALMDDQTDNLTENSPASDAKDALMDVQTDNLTENSPASDAKDALTDDQTDNLTDNAPPSDAKDALMDDQTDILTAPNPDGDDDDDIEWE